MTGQGSRDELRKEQAGGEVFLELRRQLVEVLVPGEEGPWVRALERDLPRIDEAVRVWCDRRAKDADRVLEEDRELAARVEGLREELQELTAEWHVLLEQARALEGSSEDPPEAAGAGLPERVERFRASASSWLDRVEHHEASSRTWFLESLYRDRGPVD